MPKTPLFLKHCPSNQSQKIDRDIMSELSKCNHFGPLTLMSDCSHILFSTENKFLYCSSHAIGNFEWDNNQEMIVKVHNKWLENRSILGLFLVCNTVKAITTSLLLFQTQLIAEQAVKISLYDSDADTKSW